MTHEQFANATGNANITLYLIAKYQMANLLADEMYEEKLLSALEAYETTIRKQIVEEVRRAFRNAVEK